MGRAASLLLQCEINNNSIIPMEKDARPRLLIGTAWASFSIILYSDLKTSSSAFSDVYLSSTLIPEPSPPHHIWISSMFLKILSWAPPPRYPGGENNDLGLTSP